VANGDTRNVVDGYRYWSMEAIVSDLDSQRHKFEVAIENWQHDLNIGSIVRTANAFMAARVHIVGNKPWNRRGAMVTVSACPFRKMPTWIGCPFEAFTASLSCSRKNSG
jgi:tRNA G18 (ribose-2'-O)-methylase SpoU